MLQEFTQLTGIEPTEEEYRESDDYENNQRANCASSEG